MMKQAIFSRCLMVALVTMICTTSHAGQYDEFIHYANHRDANGTLVVPQQQMKSQVQSVAEAKPMTYKTPTSQAVTQAQSSSELHHMSTSSEEVVTPQSPVVPQAISQVESSSEFPPMTRAHDMSKDVVTIQDSTEEMSPEVTSVGAMQRTVIPALPQVYAFRNTNWGMSIPEVKTKETADFSWELDVPILTAGEHRLGYSTQVEGIETTLTYGFENDRLMNAKYLFETDYDNNDAQPLLNYKTIKQWIVQNYGLPQVEEKLWKDELYRYAPELWGRALMRGHLTIVDEWDVDGTSIVLLLNGGDESVGLIAEFSTKNISQPTNLVHVSPSFLHVKPFLAFNKS